jgi:hypothetical protein
MDSPEGIRSGQFFDFLCILLVLKLPKFCPSLEVLNAYPLDVFYMGDLGPPDLLRPRRIKKCMN